MNFILEKVNLNLVIANKFYQKFFMDILQNILEVLTGGFHKSGFKL